METSDNISYIYDKNGNMVADKNKGIETIVYNHLNLPTRIFIQTDDQKGEINYIYDATGVKLAKKVTDYIHETSLTTIYANGFIYEQKENQVPELKFFSHAEGYVEPTVTSSGFEMSYVYQYKDHLGNIRLSYKVNNGSLEIVEENNYYPFGLKHKGYNDVVSANVNSVASKFKFQGVEHEEALGLDLYEMDFRNYDPAIGRFTGIDPVTHHSMSTYVAFDNNPIYWVDPSGANATTDPIKNSSTAVYSYVDNQNNTHIVQTTTNSTITTNEDGSISISQTPRCRTIASCVPRSINSSYAGVQLCRMSHYLTTLPRGYIA